MIVEITDRIQKDRYMRAFKKLRDVIASKSDGKFYDEGGGLQGYKYACTIEGYNVSMATVTKSSKWSTKGAEINIDGYTISKYYGEPLSTSIQLDALRRFAGDRHKIEEEMEDLKSKIEKLEKEWREKNMILNYGQICI